MRLRATIKVRNDVMVSARERLGLSQGALAKKADVSLHYVIDFEKLKYDRHKASSTQNAAEKLALVLEVEEEDILPPEMVGLALETQRTMVKHVDAKALLAASEAFKARMISCSPDHPSRPMSREDLAKAIETTFKTLSFREREVLKLRYGFDGEEYTLSECAKVFKVSPKRVRAVEIAAIRKLQHPARTKPLLGFLEGLP